MRSTRRLCASVDSIDAEVTAVATVGSCTERRLSLFHGITAPAHRRPRTKRRTPFSRSSSALLGKASEMKSVSRRRTTGHAGKTAAGVVAAR